ncbi:hypothetical protein l11_06310 [Neisseria weaveri LMG 5135]|nr:hypothetical protein l11_06310 [Neisseria weaveri LMG 5135]
MDIGIDFIGFGLNQHYRFAEIFDFGSKVGVIGYGDNRINALDLRYLSVNILNVGRIGYSVVSFGFEKRNNQCD